MTLHEAAPDAPDLQWYAVQVRPSQRQILKREFGGDPALAPFRVEHDLQKRGFETFVPKRTAYRLKNKYTKVKQLRAFPLLVGWVFVGWPTGENRWRALADTPGVIGVAGDLSRPMRIPAERIERLRSQWHDGKLSAHQRDTIKAHRREQFMRSRREYAPGDEVRIMGGPFDQSVCQVVEIRGSEAKVLLTLFGATRQVAIETMLLEAAA